MKVNSNAKKSEQLGMSHGKANNILRKSLIFHLSKQSGMDTCFRCNNKIDNVDDMSIEHKTAWLDSENPSELFFDIENIAFSHAKCNYSSIRRNRSLSVSNKTGYKGVSYVPNKKKHYRAYINTTIDGKRYFEHIGQFDTAKEAGEAYDKRIVEITGIESITNKKLGLL